MNMANNTYSGGTNLIAGVLQVDASSTVSSGTLQSGPLGVGPVALSGGTLQDDGNGRTLANAVTISGTRYAGRPDLRPARAQHAQYGDPHRRSDDQRHRAGYHRRPSVRQPGHGGSQHADPHRGHQ